MKSFLLSDSLMLWAAAWGLYLTRHGMFTDIVTGLSSVVSPVQSPVNYLTHPVLVTHHSCHFTPRYEG